MAAASMRLTASEARDLMNIKKEAFVKTLGILRQMADSNIKEASRRGRDYLDFDIPQSVFGRESYDPRAMGRALAEQYYEDGYDVTGTPLKLNIKWTDSSKDADSIKFPRQEDAKPAMPFTSSFKPQISARRGSEKKVSIAIK